MAKQILFDDETRRKIHDGVTKLARAVKVTLGPSGRHVIFQKSISGPTVTKDGVTVSKEIELNDPFENMGAKLVNEVASRMSDKAGDGTTTATVLAEAIYSAGLKYVTVGRLAHRAQARDRQGGRGGDRDAQERSRSRCAGSTTSEGRDDLREQRLRDRQPDRRGAREGRQGRRRHDRGRQGLRDDLRGREGHVLRQGLHLALLRHERRRR